MFYVFFCQNFIGLTYILCPQHQFKEKQAFSDNYGKKKKKNKRDKFFFNISHSSNEKIIAKSMTVLKLFKRSSKWDHAGCCSFIRLEMTEG